MLNTLKRALGIAGDAPCAGCDPAILAQCEAAEPGSVTPHSHHVLIKLAAPPGSDASATDEAWWPESVDKEPAIVAVNEAIKAAGDAIQGKVKVTAFDRLEASPPPPAGTCDALVFPACIAFHGLPLDQLPAAVVAALSGAAPPAGAAAEELQGTMLLVCCHAARDARCGHVGPPLAAKLAELAAQRGGGGSLRVLKSSHVGGHKYAGNVLVYSRGLVTSGDWFGGLHAGNAAQFFDALLACKAEKGAAGDKALRPWWRGRVGLNKDEQKELWARGLKDIEDL